MENNYKKPKKESLFSLIEKFLQKTSISQGLPIKYIYHIMFIFILGIIYVANTHYHQRILRKINILENKVSNLRVSYTTLKASCMFNLKQSEIAKKAKEIELVESKKPPFIIIN
ncbi:MAG: hypothetical protein GY830_10895 [Bacteroidetes bacterium]|nr:hypothetical protein [Bacteroidota bacterium]